MEDLLDCERLRPRRPLRFGGAPERPGAAALAQETLLRVVTINTHRGQGPKLNYLLQHSLPDESERLEVLHETRAYAYVIAEWLYRNRNRFDVVALQEVFRGILGLGDRILRRYRQHRGTTGRSAASRPRSRTASASPASAMRTCCSLDYVLHSRHFEVVSYSVIRTFRFSDHDPVRAELRLR